MKEGRTEGRKEGKTEGKEGRKEGREGRTEGKEGKGRKEGEGRKEGRNVLVPFRNLVDHHHRARAGFIVLHPAPPYELDTPFFHELGELFPRRLVRLVEPPREETDFRPCEPALLRFVVRQRLRDAGENFLDVCLVVPFERF